MCPVIQLVEHAWQFKRNVEIAIMFSGDIWSENEHEGIQEMHLRTKKECKTLTIMPKAMEFLLVWCSDVLNSVWVQVQAKK